MTQMDHHITESKDKIPVKQKVAYGLGWMSTNVAVNSFTGFSVKTDPVEFIKCVKYFAAYG